MWCLSSKVSINVAQKLTTFFDKLSIILVDVDNAAVCRVNLDYF